MRRSWLGKNREGGKSGAWKAARGCFREEKPLSWLKVVAVDRKVSVSKTSLELGSFNVSLSTYHGPAHSGYMWVCIAYLEFRASVHCSNPDSAPH